ncbi:MAG TPA: DUF4013 domain-containing protein [Promineifilum sp.]|nr:DUF4013 domain-containing protein [Promineifilum sp.]
MDINKALRFVIEDKQWISKIIIGALLTALGFLIVPALIVQGYVVKIIRQVMGGDWDGLPEWDDWGKLLGDGFKVAVATAGISGSEDVAAIAATGGGLMMLCLMLLFVVALLFLTPAILIQYAIKDDFGACFRFGEVVAIIRNNLADILIAFLVTLVASFAFSVITGILVIIPCLGWIVAFLLGMAIGPYISFVTGHLYGQIAGKVLNNKAGGAMTSAM